MTGNRIGDNRSVLYFIMYLFPMYDLNRSFLCYATYLYIHLYILLNAEMVVSKL